MNFCLRLIILFNFLYFNVIFVDAEIPGFDGFSSITNDETESLQKSDLVDDSLDLILWGKVLYLEDLQGSDALESFNDWAATVKVSMGITPRDAASISTRKEMYALRKFLSKFVSYKKPDDDSSEAKQLKRKYKYYLHLEDLAEKLNKRGLSSQYLTVSQLMELHSRGWDKKNTSDDTLNVRDILFALEQSIDQLGGSSQAPFLVRIRRKFHQIIEYAIRANAESSNDQNKSYLLEKWENLKLSNKPMLVLRFPWSEIASGQLGLRKFRVAFKYAMTLPSYLQLAYTKFFSVETMMWFGEHQQMLSALDQLDSLQGEINFDDLEKSQTGDKGRLTISELVRYTRIKPQFRELAGVLYNRYLDSLKRQSFIKEEMIAMRNKVLNVRKVPRIESLIAKLNQQEVEKVIDDFEQRVDFSSLIKPLLVISTTDGVSVSDDYKLQFLNHTGLNYDHVIQTRGDKAELLQLIRKTYPQRTSNPDFMDSMLKKVTDELQRKINSKSTLDLLESAKYQSMLRRIMSQKDASNFFLINTDKLVLESEFLNNLQTVDSAKLVESANENFDRDLSNAKSQLEELDFVSIKLRKTFQNVKFLEEELINLKQNVSKTQIEDSFREIESLHKVLSEEQNKVKLATKELKSEQSKFDLVRSRLAQLIGLSSQEIISNQVKLDNAIESYLKDFSSDDRNSNTIPERLINLLRELRQRSAVILEHLDIISKSNQKIRSVSKKISSMKEAIKSELPELIKNREILEERHALIYKRVSYLTQDEEDRIKKQASMSAEFDEDVANQYASRYLIGFLRIGDTQTTSVEGIRFHSFTQSTISFDLTLKNIQLDDNWESTESRQTVTLKVRPKVVKSHPDNFDFQIQSLILQRDGEGPIELRTGFAVILDSTLNLLNMLIASLNQTPYKKLKFKYFPHLETIRVINGLPIFESFPNFKIDLIKLLQGKIYVYGDVSGQKLGASVGRNIVNGNDSSTELETKQDGVDSEYKRGLIESSNLLGQAKIRINQKLINDFYTGMRRGVISKNSSDTDTVRFFEGLETAKIYFEDGNQVNMLFEGDFRKISGSTNRFYSLINGIASPYLGIKQGIARAGSRLIKFVTFGKVNVEVDPNDYRSPSGKFSIFLSGKSSFREGKTFLDFDTVSLYDPVHQGALQPYLGTAKVIMSVTRAAGWLYSQLLGMVDKIPGINIERPQNRLDHILLTWLAANLAHQIDSQIDDIDLEVTSFNSYNLRINDFEIVEGVDTQITHVQIENEMIEIVSAAKIDK